MLQFTAWAICSLLSMPGTTTQIIALSSLLPSRSQVHAKDCIPMVKSNVRTSALSVTRVPFGLSTLPYVPSSPYPHPVLSAAIPLFYTSHSLSLLYLPLSPSLPLPPLVWLNAPWLIGHVPLSWA